MVKAIGHMPASKIPAKAPLFAALGDPTRLQLAWRLATEGPQSITCLAQGLPVTRQAVTKHLRILEKAGLTKSNRSGRESLFELNPTSIQEINEILALITEHWDQTLCKLKVLVEKEFWI